MVEQGYQDDHAQANCKATFFIEGKIMNFLQPLHNFFKTLRTLTQSIVLTKMKKIVRLLFFLSTL